LRVEPKLKPFETQLPLNVTLHHLQDIPKELYVAQGDPPFEVEDQKLDAEVMAGFVARYLLEGFDAPTPIPAMHLAMWELVTSPYLHVVIAAPRDHAKSTSITLAYVLASALFRVADHILIISDTEGQASMFLQDITRELTENEELKLDFGVKGFIRETLTEIVVECNDGYVFRIVAKGAEQRVRGTIWRHKRPNLIVLDDCESDEQVESQDRREKLRKWVFNTLIPAGAARCRIRMVGTVMHFDSLLYRLLHDPNWVGLCFFAHDEDINQILWEDRWPRQRLVELRKVFAKQNNLAGYSREYLNQPIDESDAYFRRSWFKYYKKLPAGLTYYLATDFAISTKERADFTAFVVIGVDDKNSWYVVEIDRGHYDSNEIMERLYNFHAFYDPVAVLVEDGLIWKALEPVFNSECINRIQFPRVTLMSTAGKDKVTRSRALQFRFKIGGVYLDADAHWHDDLYFELIRFPKGPKDDQVDALSHLGMHLESMVYLPPEKTVERVQEEWETTKSLFVWDKTSANAYTGY